MEKHKDASAERAGGSLERIVSHPRRIQLSRKKGYRKSFKFATMTASDIAGRCQMDSR